MTSESARAVDRTGMRLPTAGIDGGARSAAAPGVCNEAPDHPDLHTLANFASLSEHDNIPGDVALSSAEHFRDFCQRRNALLANVQRPSASDHHDGGIGTARCDEAPKPEIGAWADPQLELAPLTRLIDDIAVA